MLVCSHGSSERTNCGKEMVSEPLELGKCEPHQLINLIAFTLTLKAFRDSLHDAYIKYMFQSDHLIGDNGEFYFEQANAVCQKFNDFNLSYQEKMKKKTSTKMTKNTYYEIVFSIMEDLLPTVKTIEQVFGDDVCPEGRYSEAVQAFLAIA